MGGRIVELTALLIGIGYVLANPDAFSTALTAVSNLYTNSVKQLQTGPGLSKVG